MHDKGKQVARTNKFLTKLFPNKVAIHMLQDEAFLSTRKQQLDKDADTLKMRENLNSLQTVVSSESTNSPVMLFVKDAEKSMARNSVSYSTFKSWLEKIPANIVIIGSHTHTDDHWFSVLFHCSRGPTFGNRGKVVLSFKDSPSATVGVQFDKPSLLGLTKVVFVMMLMDSSAKLEGTGVDDLENLLINTLFEVVSSESRNSPVILFGKDAEKSMAGNSVSYSTFKSWLEKLPDNFVITGSHSHTDDHKEKSQPGGLITKLGSTLFDLAFPVVVLGRCMTRGSRLQGRLNFCQNFSQIKWLFTCRRMKHFYPLGNNNWVKTLIL